MLRKCLSIALLLAAAIALCPIGAAQRGTNFSFDAGKNPGDEVWSGGIKLRWCPPGTFTMGSPPDEPERRPGEDQVEVTLTKGFWMGKYEVTQGLWKRVMGSLPGLMDAGEGDNFPIYNCNFFQVEEFLQKLNEQWRATEKFPADWEFRLPTEAQWEYACRAGTTTATPYGDSLSSTQANFLGDKPYNGAPVGPALDFTCEVGRYAPNAWGLYDVCGNVFEWCRDWSHPRLPGGADPDLHDKPMRSRIRRGGCFADSGWPCRSAFRLQFEPERGHAHIGFRIVAVGK